MLNIRCKNIKCCLSKVLICSNKDKEIILKHVETTPTFYAESNLEEIIIACSFVMTPDVEKASSDISLSVLKLPARIVSSPLYAEEERFSKIRRYLGE